MPRTITYSETLVVVQCWCGMQHAVPEGLRDYQQRQHRDGLDVPSIYCPLGHQHAPAGRAQVDVERDARKRAEAQLVAARDQLQAERAAAKRAAKRAAAGVCPCCHRSFVQLKRHMNSKHPDYADADA